jgi:hypothetical protein
VAHRPAAQAEEHEVAGAQVRARDRLGRPQTAAPRCAASRIRTPGARTTRDRCNRMCPGPSRRTGTASRSVLRRRAQSRVRRRHRAGQGWGRHRLSRHSRLERGAACQDQRDQRQPRQTAVRHGVPGPGRHARESRPRPPALHRCRRSATTAVLTAHAGRLESPVRAPDSLRPRRAQGASPVHEVRRRKQPLDRATWLRAYRAPESAGRTVTEGDAAIEELPHRGVIERSCPLHGPFSPSA